VDNTRIAQLVSNLLGDAITQGNPDHPIRIDALLETVNRKSRW